MCQAKKALEEIKAKDCLFITPAEAAKVLGCDPHYIRVAAKKEPELLGFPVTRVGSRTKIPKDPFMQTLTTPLGLTPE